MSEFQIAQNCASMARSAAAVGVIVAVGVAALVDASPATVNVAAAPLSASGLRLTQVSDATELPGWLLLPPRSSVPVSSTGESGLTRRIYFTSLQSTEDIAFHFQKTLLIGGFRIATLKPHKTRSGLVRVIDGVDASVQRAVQLYIREAGGLRAVEMKFREAGFHTAGLAP